MTISNSRKQRIKELLSNTIEGKLKSYGRETISMPFLARLIQDNKKIAAYSFIHSMATTLEMSIYEDVSVIFVGNEYWDFIGGKGTFPELLQTFDEVGKAFKSRLEKKFNEIAQGKLDSY